MDISVNYMGLKLTSPIIVGSSGLTNTVEKVIDIEKNGAGAVVLKSLFEEQIRAEADFASKSSEYAYSEALDYIQNYVQENSFAAYLKLIRDCKGAVKIPLIASVNCVTPGEWTYYAKKIQDAGADALELNVSLIPTNENMSSTENEKVYFDISKKVRKEISIPIALKMSNYSSGLSNLIQQLSWTGNIDSFVLFNRYYQPDIDIDTLELKSGSVFSTANDITTSLRWIALLSDKVEKPLIASTGIHDGAAMIKQLLAGATAVQMASALYKNGTGHIQSILEELKSWMAENAYSSIDDFRGKIVLEHGNKAVAFERVQFMKYFAGIE